MSRTMSGIPTSGGGGDVTLAGNPNAFTGTNTYDVNRPTSSLTSTPAATEFITKQDADGDYALLAGNPNTFTGTNTYNVNRPTSSLTSTPAATEFITKQDADAITTGKFAQTTRANPTLSYVVGGGNPSTSSGGDSLNGRMDSPYAGLMVEITPPSNASIKIDFSIFGEWDADGWDKGIIIARAGQAADGSFTYDFLLDADLDLSAPNAVRVITTFTNNYTRDASTTPEQSIGFYIDDDVVAGTKYRYTPVLVNAAVTGSNHTFKLNRPITNSNLSFAERGCSAITATILNV